MVANLNFLRRRSGFIGLELAVLVALLAGMAAGTILVQQNQNLQKHAQTPSDIAACKADCSAKSGTICDVPGEYQYYSPGNTCTNREYISFMDLNCSSLASANYGKTGMFICCKQGCNPPPTSTPAVSPTPPAGVATATPAPTSTNQMTCEEYVRKWGNPLGQIVCDYITPGPCEYGETQYQCLNITCPQDSRYGVGYPFWCGKSEKDPNGRKTDLYMMNKDGQCTDACPPAVGPGTPTPAPVTPKPGDECYGKNNGDVINPCVRFACVQKNPPTDKTYEWLRIKRACQNGQAYDEASDWTGKSCPDKCHDKFTDTPNCTDTNNPDLDADKCTLSGATPTPGKPTPTGPTATPDPTRTALCNNAPCVSEGYPCADTKCSVCPQCQAPTSTPVPQPTGSIKGYIYVQGIKLVVNKNIDSEIGDNAPLDVLPSDSKLNSERKGDAAGHNILIKKPGSGIVGTTSFKYDLSGDLIRMITNLSTRKSEIAVFLSYKKNDGSNGELVYTKLVPVCYPDKDSNISEIISSCGSKKHSIDMEETSSARPTATLTPTPVKPRIAFEVGITFTKLPAGSSVTSGTFTTTISKGTTSAVSPIIYQSTDFGEKKDGTQSIPEETMQSNRMARGDAYEVTDEDLKQEDTKAILTANLVASSPPCQPTKFNNVTSYITTKDLENASSTKGMRINYELDCSTGTSKTSNKSQKFSLTGSTNEAFAKAFNDYYTGKIFLKDILAFIAQLTRSPSLQMEFCDVRKGECAIPI